MCIRDRFRPRRRVPLGAVRHAVGHRGRHGAVRRLLPSGVPHRVRLAVQTKGPLIRNRAAIVGTILLVAAGLAAASALAGRSSVDPSPADPAASATAATAATTVSAQTAVPTTTVSYTHLRAHETVLDLVCR